MSDNIPFDIQMEIIKKVSNVKSLIRFRSVSKQWMSSIHSSRFIKAYGARHTQPRSHILSYQVGYSSYPKFICLVDDDNETFKVQKQEFAPFVISPLLKQYHVAFVVGASHGLLCLYCHKNEERMIVIWNPYIGKSFGIYWDSMNHAHFGFGVCPVTQDPIVVKISQLYMEPWHAEVFTLSSGVWNVIPSIKLSRGTIRLNVPTSQVVIDRFIYWSALEDTFTDDGEYTRSRIVVSFDLITKEFKMVDLPHSLKNDLRGSMCVSKLRESLVVYGSINVKESDCGVWVMEHDKSFRMLFTVGAMLILGFRKNVEPIIEILNGDVDADGWDITTLNVYDPHSQQIKYLGISGVVGLFFMCSYKESLLLLDHVDSRIY